MAVDANSALAKGTPGRAPELETAALREAGIVKMRVRRVAKRMI